MIFLVSQIANAGENNKVRPLINPIIGSYSYRTDNTDIILTMMFQRASCWWSCWSKIQIQTKGLAKVLPNMTGRTRVLYTQTVASEVNYWHMRFGTFGPVSGPQKLKSESMRYVLKMPFLMDMPKTLIDMAIPNAVLISR